MTFAEKLRAERKRLKLTAKQAAALFVDADGHPLLPTGTWQQWEYSRRVPTKLEQHFVLTRLNEAS